MLRNTRHSESGVVVVMVAVMLPLFVGLLAFAIDASNKWVHQRHLQTQVDAGVFAGGFGPWFPACDDDPNRPNSIVGKALEYSGDLNRGALFNEQYSNEDNVHVLVNATGYWGQGGADNTDGGSPCATLAADEGRLDLKATEANLPTFFGGIFNLNFFPWINAQARVELQQAGQEDNVRPIAVRDNAAYQCAQIILAQANPNGTLGAQYPDPIDLPERTGPPDVPYTQFQNPAGTPVQMPSQAQNLFVRVRLFANRDPGTGACTGPSDDFPWDANGDAPVGGANFINVYSLGSSPDPLVRSVTLGPACAPDQYFSYNSICSVTVSADVSFAGGGDGIVMINGTLASGSGTYTASFGVSPQSGPNQYRIEVEQQTGSTSKGACTDKNNNPCKFSFGVQQQAYSATDDEDAPSNSGPINLLQIGDGAPGLGANSFEKGTAPNLVFTVRLATLANALPSDPPIIIRYSVQRSKRTGVVDCGQGNGDVTDTIVNGCPRPVFIWPTGTPCVTPTNSPAGTAIDCVGIVTGNRAGQIRQGFRDRIGRSCNNWNAYRDFGTGRR